MPFKHVFHNSNGDVRFYSIFVMLICVIAQSAYALDQGSEDSEKREEEAAIYSKSTASSPIALSADNLFLWSVNPDQNTVTVVRTDRQKIVAKIAVGAEPRSLAISPSGRFVYVANAAGNSISVIRVWGRDPDHFFASLDPMVGGGSGELTTGAEPRSIVVTPDGKKIFVANRSQDTITVINSRSKRIVGSFDLRNSECNVGDRDRHFQPGALAVTKDSKILFVTRFFSFTANNGVQRDDQGKEGILCSINVDTRQPASIGLMTPKAIHLATRDTGFTDINGKSTYAFPNQMQSLVVRGQQAYLPNIAASPTGPSNFKTTTQAFVNVVSDVNGYPRDQGAINLHLGGRDPEPGKQELYFANPIAIGFTTEVGAGYAYVAASGSDILVKLKVDDDGALAFTVDGDTTRYIDLNDPDSSATSGARAGKNPLGLVVNASGSTAYVLNYVSRNVSVVDLRADRVVNVIQVEDLPVPGSKEERILVGAEMFFSSRGNFVRPSGARGSSINRLSEKGRQNCASCHFGGLSDGIVWQFASGPRKTLPINGTFNRKDKTDQRIINASAIFDEVEDADFNTRLVSSAGLLADPRPCIATPPVSGIYESKIDPDHGLVLGEWDSFDFAACVMTPFTVPNAGRPQPLVQLPGSKVTVKALDALVEWQHYAIRTPNRPMTKNELSRRGGDTSGGVDESEIVAGAQLFREAGCSGCHSGGKWTTSRKDFISPPAPAEIATESGVAGVNQAQYLYRFLKDIGSFNLNVKGTGNVIAGYPSIGGIEKDSNGLGALGFDYNGDGKGSGYNVSSILGTYQIPPYYHNGACETLRCVVSDVNHRKAGLGGRADPLVNDRNRAALVKYLESIDSNSQTF